MPDSSFPLTDEELLALGVGAPGGYDPSGSATPGTARSEGEQQFLAERAGLTPEQAQGMPDAILRSLALNPSYAEGENAPGPQLNNLQPPVGNPAAEQAETAWEDWLWNNRASVGKLGTNFARGGRVRRSAPGALHQASIRHIALNKLARRARLRSHFAGALVTAARR